MSERYTKSPIFAKIAIFLQPFLRLLSFFCVNAGGLYGNARPENFPGVNDYRNPLIASAMKTLGYVNMFNRGIRQVQIDLKENGNKPAVFDVSLITAFKVTVETSGPTAAEVIIDRQAPNEQDLSQVVPGLSQALSPVLSPVCPQLNESVLLKMEKVLLQLQQSASSISELMAIAEEKNKNRFRQKVLKSLLEVGLIETTIKDTPNSPKQKYVLSAKARNIEVCRR